MDYLTPDLDVPELWQYGAKALGYKWVGEAWTDRLTKPYLTFEDGADLREIERRVNDKFGKDTRLIARTSSPLELRMGSAGLWRSIADFGAFYLTPESIKSAVSIIRLEGANSNEIGTFLRYQGLTEAQNLMPVLLQRHSESVFSGSVVRHPNQPDQVIVEVTALGDVDGTLIPNIPLTRYQYRKRGSVRLTDSGDVADGPHVVGGMNFDSAFSTGHRLFSRIESLPFISPEWSYQIEFGCEPLSFFQVRPFLRRKTADFRLSPDGREYSVTGSYSFGATASDGVVLPVIRSVSVNYPSYFLESLDPEREKPLIEAIERAESFGAVSIHRIQEKELARTGLHSALAAMSARYPDGFCLVMDQYENEGYLDFVMGNARAVLIQDEQYSPTSHDMTRLLQKTDVVGFGGTPFDNFQTGDTVRVRSDGRIYTAEKVADAK